MLATVMGGSFTIVASVGVAVSGISAIAFTKFISTLPDPATWMFLGSMIAAIFTAGGIVSGVAARRLQRDVLDVAAAEKRLAHVRGELATIEKAVADRAIEYAEIGQRLQENSALLRLTQEQTAAVRRMTARAVRAAGRSWW